MQQFLKINKCSYDSFSRKTNAIEFKCKINDSKLNKYNEVKNFDVIFDGKLSFISHVNDVVIGAYRNLECIIRNSRYFVDNGTLKLLFNALVRSKIECASVVWKQIYKI